VAIRILSWIMDTRLSTIGREQLLYSPAGGTIRCRGLRSAIAFSSFQHGNNWICALSNRTTAPLPWQKFQRKDRPTWAGKMPAWFTS